MYRYKFEEICWCEPLNSNAKIIFLAKFLFDWSWMNGQVTRARNWVYLIVRLNFLRLFYFWKLDFLSIKVRAKILEISCPWSGKIDFNFNCNPCQIPFVEYGSNTFRCSATVIQLRPLPLWSMAFSRLCKLFMANFWSWSTKWSVLNWLDGKFS